MAKRKQRGRSARKTKKAKKNAPESTKESSEECWPELYITVPRQAKRRKPGQLTKKQLNEYFEKGFIIVKDVIDHKILDDIRDDIAKQVGDLADKLFEAGKIKNKHEDKSFLNRLTFLEKEYPGTAVLLLKSDYLSTSFQKLWSYDKLLNIVEQIIGPEVSGHPVWNLRPKVPNSEQVNVPWHQDNAYFEPSAAGVFLATAWIPFVDAHKENGCMQMIPAGHRKGKTATHTCCAGETLYVDLDPEVMKKELDADVKDAITCEIPYGGVLLFNNCIPHKSLENLTDGIRWSVDFRWQRSTDPPSSFGDSVVMRTAKDPNLKIDWSKVTDEKLGRNKMQEKNLGASHGEFVPLISGPWMNRWEIVHHNKHTELHAKTDDKKS